MRTSVTTALTSHTMMIGFAFTKSGRYGSIDTAIVSPVPPTSMGPTVSKFRECDMMVGNARSCTAEHATMRETSHFEPVSTQILHEKKHCTVDATIA